MTVYSNGQIDVNMAPRSITQRGMRDQLTQANEFASRAQANGISIPDSAVWSMPLTHPRASGAYSPDWIGHRIMSQGMYVGARDARDALP